MNKHIALFFEAVNEKDKNLTSSVQSVADTFIDRGCTVTVVEISRNGQWMIEGEYVDHEDVLPWCDYAFVCKGGPHTHSGRLQEVFDAYRVLHGGSDSLLVRLTGSVSACRDLLVAQGIETMAFERIVVDDIEQSADYIFQNIPQPCVLRSDTDVNSESVWVASSKQEIIIALKKLTSDSTVVVVEGCVGGDVVSALTVEHYRDQNQYVFPVVRRQRWFSMVDTVNTEGEYSVLSQDDYVAGQYAKIEEITRKVHRNLHLSDYSQVNLIMHPQRGPLVVAVDTVPDFVGASAWSVASAAVGANLEEVIDLCIEKKQ